MTDRFSICLPFVLAWECPVPDQWSNIRNFSNDPHDPGGETMCGITQREYSRYRISSGQPSQDVRLISRDEGEDIYLHSYWLPKCPLLPRGIDLCYFDECVNAGPHAATMILQEALGVVPDGVWGPITDAAVKNITNLPGMVVAYTRFREDYYRRLSGFEWFGRGWINRSESIGQTALKMAE